jgi:hypothetical protein
MRCRLAVLDRLLNFIQKILTINERARLRRLQQASPGALVLVGPPHVPFGPSLQAQGLAVQRLLWLQVSEPQARLWATDEALGCAQSGSGNTGFVGDEELDLTPVHATGGVDLFNSKFGCVLGGRTEDTRGSTEVSEQSNGKRFGAGRFTSRS